MFGIAANQIRIPSLSTATGTQKNNLGQVIVHAPELLVDSQHAADAGGTANVWREPAPGPSRHSLRSYRRTFAGVS